jgi:hypothetical protein
MNFKCDVFCPVENWRVEALVPALPRDGDQIRHKDKLYKVGGVEHSLVPHADADLYGYLVRKPLVYVSPIK